MLLLSAALSASAPAARVARYVLVESRTAVTPAGEQASAVRGAVTVLDGSARWDLETGRFPRSRADALLLGERGGWLLDRKGAVAARVSAEDVSALWIPPAEGESGPFQARVEDVVVESFAPERGPAFEGRATVRRRASASWSVVTALPGRVNRVRVRLAARVDLLEDPPPEVRSPLDDPGRHFDVPEEVRRELAAFLAGLRGFPVAILVETEAEQSLDHPGMETPPSDGRRPLRTRVEAARTVSALTVAPSVPGEAAPFALSEETRVVGLERLVEARESLR